MIFIFLILFLFLAYVTGLITLGPTLPTEYFISLIFFFFIYFLPFLIALMRGHKDILSVFVINLFLGWTLIGWVVALAWSVKGK